MSAVFAESTTFWHDLADRPAGQLGRGDVEEPTTVQGDAQEQPIVLSIEEGNPNRANVRFLIDNAALPADCDSYERVVLVFNGDDADALTAARGAWADCKARGFELTYWQADERGRWQRRQ